MKSDGFTLIEMMAVVVLISVLSAIVQQRCAAAYRKCHEATTKGNLGSLRSAIAIYYGDTEGGFPTDDLTSLVRCGYLINVPIKSTPPFHPDGNSVTARDFSLLGPTHGDWAYDNAAASRTFGNVIVNCNHSDLRGASWSTY